MEKHSGKGPYFLGDFSYVDTMFMPSLERFAANMPFVRGLPIKGRSDLPHLAAWFEALDARPAYQQVHRHSSDAFSVFVLVGYRRPYRMPSGSDACLASLESFHMYHVGVDHFAPATCHMMSR